MCQRWASIYSELPISCQLKFSRHKVIFYFFAHRRITWQCWAPAYFTMKPHSHLALKCIQVQVWTGSNVSQKYTFMQMVTSCLYCKCHCTFNCVANWLPHCSSQKIYYHAKLFGNHAGWALYCQMSESDNNISITAETKSAAFHGFIHLMSHLFKSLISRPHD